ncbi:hypothetical protein EMIT051CA3_60044 [Pseudomonas chlororaphis]
MAASRLERAGMQPTAQLFAQWVVDKSVNNPLRAFNFNMYRAVRNFLRSAAQKVAHFFRF